MDLTLIALGIAPGIAICLFIFHRDAYNREPKLNLIICFLLGALSVVPAFFIETALTPYFNNSLIQIAASSFFVVALAEESGKFAALRLYAYNQKSFDEPLDGIVYAVVVSMGFATVENVLYVLHNGIGNAFIRMFLSVPGHATFAVMMGYYVGMAKFDPKNRARFMAIGLLLAVLFHGTFDTFLFMAGSPQVTEDTSKVLLFIGAVISFIIALRFSWLHIQKRRRFSQQTYAPLLHVGVRTAVERDIPLIRDLTYRIWPQTYESILKKEQIDYMLNMMYSEQSLLDQMQKQGHEFVIVNDGKVGVGFASFSMIEPGVWKLHKIYILPAEQGKGVGKFVIDQVSAAVLRRGATALQLNVNRNNNAKDFYEKLGFTVLRSEDIDIGSGYFMNDYIMEKKL